MKTKINYLFIFLGCMLIFPHIAKADCSYEREAELSRIASNVQFNYTYGTDIGVGVFFNIYITNLTTDIYIEDDQSNRFSGNGEQTREYYEGQTVQFDIYSNDDSCKGKIILTQYVSLPTYNIYSQSEDCKKYPNFKYCQIWAKTSLDTKEFQNELNDYKTANENKNYNENEGNFLIEFYNNHKLLTIISGICVIVSIIIYLFIRRIRRKQK